MLLNSGDCLACSFLQACKVAIVSYLFVGDWAAMQFSKVYIVHNITRLITVSIGSRLCNTLPCEHACQPSPQGGFCYCQRGFQLNWRDNTTCQGKRSLAILTSYDIGI